MTSNDSAREEISNNVSLECLIESLSKVSDCIDDARLQRAMDSVLSRMQVLKSPDSEPTVQVTLAGFKCIKNGFSMIVLHLLTALQWKVPIWKRKIIPDISRN